MKDEELIWQTRGEMPVPTNPLQELQEIMTRQSRDMAEDKLLACLYGIIVGWDDASYEELKAQHGWNNEIVERQKKWHENYNKAWSLYMNPPKASVNWNPVIDLPKEEWGWYLIAILPKDYLEKTPKQVNEWRRRYGVALAWFDNTKPEGKKWYGRWDHTEPIDGFVTHWAETSEVPVPEI